MIQRRTVPCGAVWHRIQRESGDARRRTAHAVPDLSETTLRKGSVEQQWVSEQMSSVPAVDLSLGVIERYHGVLAVRIVERQADGAPLLGVEVVRVVDDRRRCDDVSHQVQQAARHEPVAVVAVSHGDVPSLLYDEVVWVELGHQQRAVLVLGAVDDPQAVLVNCQVKVVELGAVQVLSALQPTMQSASPQHCTNHAHSTP